MSSLSIERLDFEISPLLMLPGLVLFAISGVVLPFRGSLTLYDAFLLVVPGSVLIFGSYAIHRSGIPESRYPRILGWAGAGAVAVSLVPVVMLQSPYVTVHDPLVAVTIGLWLGAVGGLTVGFQEARHLERALETQVAHGRAGTAERERVRLEQLNHLLRHDILNKVAVIQGYSKLTLDEADEGDTLRAETDVQRIETINRQAGDIEELIRNVRAYLESLDDTGDSLGPQPLSSILQREIATLEASFPECSVTSDLQDDITVRADSLLSSVFCNLLRNAVVHNRDSLPAVTVSMEVSEDTARVRIADNGPGIPDTVQQRLFSPSESGDHGFGLFLVKTLVDRYGGTLTLEETGETGTTFVVSLVRVLPATD